LCKLAVVVRAIEAPKGSNDAPASRGAGMAAKWGRRVRPRGWSG